jgi:hypothetical protein
LKRVRSNHPKSHRGVIVVSITEKLSAIPSQAPCG